MYFTIFALLGLFFFVVLSEIVVRMHML